MKEDLANYVNSDTFNRLFPEDKSEVDKIMALLDAMRSAAFNHGYEDAHPSNAWTRQDKAAKKVDAARAALRAAVERVIAERDRWEQIGRTQSDSIYRMTAERVACDKYLKEGETPAERMERDHLDSLALMGLLAKEKIRAERAEAERDKEKAKYEFMLQNYQEVDKDNDALRALLVRIRDATHTNAVTLRGMADEGLARIDAQLEGTK